MPNRAEDWLDQAQRNLEQAEASRRDGRHEWACFAAQQAAELAVKALHLWHGQEAWGHVVARLLEDLPEAVPAELVERSMVLDNFYIPTRSPNGHPEGAPYHHFGKYQSGEAIQYAGEVIAFVRARLAEKK
jgi:HEPN domain-containing protein